LASLLHNGAAEMDVSNQIPTDLRFVEPEHTEVGGMALDDMLVCNTTGILGRLQGFIVDPVAHRVRYLVVQTNELLTKLMPVGEARIDLDSRSIQLLDQETPNHAEPFKRELFPAF
jgi:hypothetical protein